MKKEYFIWLGLLVFGALFIGYSLVKAGSPYFVSVATTSGTTATTTLSNMSAGYGTTTLVYDSYLNYGTSEVNGNLYATLLVQFHASSAPATILKWRYEYSNDNKDWYLEDIDINNNATTTIKVSTFHEDSWAQISTSTVYSADGNATTSLAFKKLSVPVHTRYVRAVFYIPAGSTGGSLWAEFIGFKQR